MAGSGLWMPEAQPLALLRRNIDRKPERIRNVLMEPLMRKHVLNVSKDAKKAIKAFAGQNQDNALKTKPKVRKFSFSCVSRFVRGCRFVAVVRGNDGAQSRQARIATPWAQIA
jgi:uncharacterized protein (DUF2461 family)